MRNQGTMFRRELEHVYWIGGSPCAGKSSLAEILAARYGLYLYQADEAYVRHEKIVTQESHPIFYKLTHSSSEDVWMRPVEQQVEEEIRLYQEEFPLILEELLALPKSQPILAEGAALLPECVIPLLSERQQATWIIPTEEFQLTHYGRRAWAKEVVKTCTNPEQAFHNWMQRDRRFAAFIEQEASRRGMAVMVIDGTRSLTDNTTLVERYFQLV
jgi:2-phosphoglycerate kinase